MDSTHSQLNEPHESIPILDQPVTEDDILCMKLRQEINHLRRWLEAHQESRQKSGSDLTPTIKSLIQTREKLLYSLEQSALAEC